MGWSRHHRFGLLHHERERAFPGYTLIVPNGGLDASHESGIDRYAALVDMEGRICHRWNSATGLKYGRLLPNGNLLGRTRASGAVEGAAVLGGSSAAIVELDWDSNIVWKHDNPMLHHDFERLPNGNTLVLLWDEMPTAVSERVGGGYRTNGESPRMLGDVVQEITPSGLVAYEWRSWEHLDFAEDVICPLDDRRVWTHANSVTTTRGGDPLVSFRSTSVVCIVDRSTGNLAWRWGPGQISHQHHATSLPDGHVLLFDNGLHGLGMPRSRVVEVDPSDHDRVVWEYVGNPPVSFFSPLISGADRLPNGNTLVCEGSHGRIFEVTPDRDIVWEYVSPYFLPIEGGESNALFRAHRYGSDHPALRGRDMDPDRFANVKALHDPA